MFYYIYSQYFSSNENKNSLSDKSAILRSQFAILFFRVVLISAKFHVYIYLYMATFKINKENDILIVPRGQEALNLLNVIALG